MKTSLTELLGIQYPIIQGAMAWTSEHTLAAAVANAGATGVIATGGRDTEWVRQEIRQCKSLTDKPFGVNLMLMALNLDDILAVIVEEKPAFITLGAGNPVPFIEPLHVAGIKVIPVVPNVKLAKRVAAAGADAILLDVTVGEGAFMKTVDEARQLAQTMVNLGKAVGRKTVAVITDMSQPLGRAIGNRLEILEALEILQGKGREDISHFICELAQIMLSLANVEKTVEEVRQHLENGQALKKFEEMVLAQGGNLEDLYRPVKVDHVIDIPAQEDGIIAELPAMEFGLFAMRLGAGRAVKTDALDYETGIVFEKKVGESVKKGEIVAKVYANGKISPELVTDFQKYVKIKMSDETLKMREIIEIIS